MADPININNEAVFAPGRNDSVSYNYVWDDINEYWTPQVGEGSSSSSQKANIDAFGRLRVSNPETIFNSKQIFDNQPLYWDDIQESGSGTSTTYSSARASSVLAVSATTAGKRTRQTFMRFNYQPSKSQLIFITGVLKKSGGGTGITTRIGLFDDDNGLFLESDTTTNFVLRSSVSGSVVDTSTAQSNWNIDSMDGNGPSGITLDFSKTQILVIDFEWLGVGRVRFGFNVDGVTYYCHEILNANNKDAVYMSTPNLPLRYQIENDGTGAASSMEAICSAVISEGGKEEIGTNTYVSTQGTSITSTKDNLNALVAIRLKEPTIGCTVDITDMSIITTSNDNYEWQLLINPSGIESFNYSGDSNSRVEYCTAPSETHISGGYLMGGGYGQAKSEIYGDQLKNQLKLGSSITGLRDVIVLALRPLGSSNAVVYGGMSMREFN
jgi:hypothetical protein